MIKFMTDYSHFYLTFPPSRKREILGVNSILPLAKNVGPKSQFPILNALSQNWMHSNKLA